MHQSGEYRIGARREAVWDALNDPDVLVKCIDGCESLTRTGDDAFQARVKARIGPMSASFDGEVRLADLDPPRSYRLEFSAKGGAAGFGKGSASVTLDDDGEATLLRYEVEGSVGGKLAQVGQRLVDAAARKMADDFFACFGERVAPGASTKTQPPEAAAEPTEPPKRPFGVLAAVAVAAIALVAVVVLMLKR